MKKLMLVALTLCFILSACGTNSTTGHNTSEIGSEGSKSVLESDFTYDIVSDINKTATITGYTGKAKKISIPEVIDGYKIIGISSLSDCNSVTKITLPNSDIEISKEAFEDTGYYSNKENWVDGTLYLDDYLIAADSNVTVCNVKEGTKHIANSAFVDCLNLETVTLPDSVISIGSSAFSETDLANIVLGNGLKRIGDSAFAECQNLMSIELPQSVEYIGHSAFSETKILDYDLDCIYMGKCLVWVNRDYEGEFQVKDGTIGITSAAFESCEDITNIVFPNSVKSIGWSAFSHCNGLQALNLGSNVSYIGESAFSDCENLTSITLPETISYLGDAFWTGCEKLTNISFAGENAFFISEQSGLYSKDKKTLICVPNNVEGVYNVDDRVEHICSYAFANCENITEIVLPSSLPYIGKSVFEDCKGLTNIIIPEKVEYIGESAFRHCNKLKSISASDNNKSYSSENGVLFNKDKTILVLAPKSELKTYSIPSSVTQIGKCAFADSELINISIPDSVERIDDGAFSNCANLESITLPDNINHIGRDAFSYCEKIQQINIPANLKIIGQDAFSDLPSVTAIKIPGTVETIGSGAFSSCDSLENVEIQSGVKCIEFAAFMGCDSLTTIKIPASVSDIDSWAFKDSTALTDIYFAGSKMQWKAYGIVDIGGPYIHYNAQ